MTQSWNWIPASLLAVTAGLLAGAEIREDFSRNPLTNGWRTHGRSSLFQWDAASQSLQVTWDSSQTNSYFYHPLNTILAKADDFQISLSLTLERVTPGTSAGKPFAFELAFGFVNLAGAISTNFLRGTGRQSPNLVELDYFPDTGFGATVWPTAIDTNSVFNYSGADDYTLLELPTQVRLDIRMGYQGQTHTLTTAITANGQSLGPVNPVVLTETFKDFRLDAFAICSYSDAKATGSIFAQGRIDDLQIVVPEPPIQALKCLRLEPGWGVEFQGLGDWTYQLERSDNLRLWTPVAETLQAAPARVRLADPAASSPAAFYRVKAGRP